MLLQLEIQNDLLEVHVEQLSLVLLHEIHDLLPRHFSVRIDSDLVLLNEMH